MIRANLLPRPKESFSLFGLRVDAEYARIVLAGAVLVILVASIGFAIERFRIERLEAEVADATAIVAAHAPERAAAEQLAFQLANYESFARATAAFRRSGAEAAVTVARIGNALPRTVWLDRIDRDPGGFTLAGTARRIDAVGDAIVSLASTPSAKSADIVSLDAGDESARTVRFSARLLTLERGAL